MFRGNGHIKGVAVYTENRELGKDTNVRHVHRHIMGCNTTIN